MRELDKHREHDWYYSAPSLQGEEDALHLYLYYSKAGTSYFTGKSHPAGYYVSVRPVLLTEYGEQYAVFDDRGRRYLLEEAPRFNRRKLEALHGTALDTVASYVHEIACVEVPA
ncbi:hypothetical protein [Dietzia natronolimnaea]|uniref:hypothetical protein n=1 Tax=Dietzia natronolimnaea TaxID=161920 RepID=UPI0015FAB0E5|nr:hypothetical protein [Dietzia natronolimnaea]MBB1037371.1 hypothetical protein [Dietzia natronolimnaea]